jgi:hypothetical protein
MVKPLLRPLLDERWSITAPGTLQLAGEADAFSEFLQQKLSRGEFNGPYVEEIVRHECAAWEVIHMPRRSMPDSKRPRRREVRGSPVQSRSAHPGALPRTGRNTSARSPGGRLDVVTET